MKKRILLENGKFSNFTGKSSPIKIKTEGEKLMERKSHEELSKKMGIVADNPEVEGELTVADRMAIEKGMKFIDMATLANVRKIDVPLAIETAKELKGFLLDGAAPTEESETESELEMGLGMIKNGEMSIPEMRLFASENLLTVPSTLRNKDVITKHILEGLGPKEEEEDGL